MSACIARSSRRRPLRAFPKIPWTWLAALGVCCWPQAGVGAQEKAAGITALRAAIDDLEATFDDRYPGADRFRLRLEKAQTDQQSLMSAENPRQQTDQAP